MAKYVFQLRRGWKETNSEGKIVRDDWDTYEKTKYVASKAYSSTTTYYIDNIGTIANPQPTKEEVKGGNFYIENPAYMAPLAGELVLEYDNGVPRLKIGNGTDDFSGLPYMSVDSFILPTPTKITLYGGDQWWQSIEGYERRYTQDITSQLAGKITSNSKIDLQPTPEQLCMFHDKDVTFTTVNEDGTVRVCAIGVMPENTYEDIQVTITEVVENG